MNTILIRTLIDDNSSEYGISLTCSNPKKEHYIACKDQENANKLLEILKLFPDLIWDGKTDAPNVLFGESYGIDWCYVSKESSDIIVDGKLIKVGDLLLNKIFE